MRKAVWTEEQVSFIYKNYKLMHLKEILVEINKLGPEKSFDCLKSFYARKHLRSGFDTKFKKGGIPHNKGVPMTPEQKAVVMKTAFKKGNIPWSTCEVGTERWWHKDSRHQILDYIYVKVAQPDVWRPKSQVMWEKYHNEKLQESECVIFLDGNRENFAEENLCKVTRGELVTVNHNYHDFDTSEERQLCIDIVKLDKKLKEMGKC